MSPSARRAWIEISAMPCVAFSSLVALRTEGVDRNRPVQNTVSARNRSPSARRAWIEICWNSRQPTRGRVALRTEGVDRNAGDLAGSAGKQVALRTEGVDRNILVRLHLLFGVGVALRTEGVDRNLAGVWQFSAEDVALRTEGVDRNSDSPISAKKADSRPPHGGRG